MESLPKGFSFGAIFTTLRFSENKDENTAIKQVFYVVYTQDKQMPLKIPNKKHF